MTRQRARTINVACVLCHVKRHLHVAHGAKVVHLIRPGLQWCVRVCVSECVCVCALCSSAKQKKAWQLLGRIAEKRAPMESCVPR